jgi:hypothetical protein
VSGTVYWETSGDGYSWTVRRSLATPAWVTTRQVAVDFPTTRTGGTTGYVEWDLVGATISAPLLRPGQRVPRRLGGPRLHRHGHGTDLFKRLNRQPALRSMLTEEIIEQTPTVYYPLTEDSASTSAGDMSGNGCPDGHHPGRPAAPSPWAARTGRSRPASRYRCSRRRRRPPASG